jgi:hypothetical protein
LPTRLSYGLTPQQCNAIAVISSGPSPVKSRHW